MTGFEVAKDLLKLDFSTPEDAPEEFRAVTFNAPPAKKGMRMPSLTALEIQTQGELKTCRQLLFCLHQAWLSEFKLFKISCATSPQPRNA